MRGQPVEQPLLAGDLGEQHHAGEEQIDVEPLPTPVSASSGERSAGRPGARRRDRPDRLGPPNGRMITPAWRQPRCPMSASERTRGGPFTSSFWEGAVCRRRRRDGLRRPTLLEIQAGDRRSACDKVRPREELMLSARAPACTIGADRFYEDTEWISASPDARRSSAPPARGSARPARWRSREAGCAIVVNGRDARRSRRRREEIRGRRARPSCAIAGDIGDAAVPRRAVRGLPGARHPRQQQRRPAAAGFRRDHAARTSCAGSTPTCSRRLR